MNKKKKKDSLVAEMIMLTFGTLNFVIAAILNTKVTQDATVAELNRLQGQMSVEVTENLINLNQGVVYGFTLVGAAMAITALASILTKYLRGKK